MLIFFVNRFSSFFAAHFRTKGILNDDKIIFVWGCFDNICMRVFHSVMIQEKPPSKRCRIGSKFWDRYAGANSADPDQTVTRTAIKSLMSSNSGQIGLSTLELLALEWQKAHIYSPALKKLCHVFPSFCHSVTFQMKIFCHTFLRNFEA